jgi:hypothetical protein
MSETESEPTEPNPTEPNPTEPGHLEQAAQAEPAQAEPAQAEPAQADAAQPEEPQQGGFVPGLSAPSLGLEYLVERQRRRGRRFAAVAGVVVAIVIIAGLLAVASGGHGPSRAQLTAAQVVAKAAQREAGVQSYTAAMKEQVTGSTSATVSGTIKFQRSPLEVATSLVTHASGQSAPASAIVTNSAMYVKVPGLAGVPGLPAEMASKWLKLPLIGPGGTSPLAGIEQELQRENPVSETSLFAAAEHLRKTGSQVVDGISTTKYTGSVTTAHAVKSLPTAERAQLAPYLRLVTGKIAVAVWIGGNGDIKKIDVAERVGTDNVTTTITFLTFNQPLGISIPPASQVYSVPRGDMTD